MDLIPPFLLLISIISLSASTSYGAMESKIGVCYGELGNDLPKPSDSINLIKKLGAKRIKIYGTNRDIIESIRKTDLQISIMVPNQLIPKIYNNQTLADDWVRENVAKFYNQSKIRYLLVGNEILSNQPNSTWFQLVPAMRKIRIAVKNSGLQKIKIGTPLAMDCLESSFPPSNGTFRSTVREEVIKPLLSFLNRTKSYFFVDAYPYFAWASAPHQIDLNYALLERTSFRYTDPVTGLMYTNLLEQMLDAVVHAMKRVGYPDIRLFVAETGWPNGGDLDQIGANIHNAATYNRNLVKWFMEKPTRGTPERPQSVIPVMIFALFNENNKTGPGTERHFGLLYPNGTNVYPIDLSGKKRKFPPLPEPEPWSNVTLWCVAKPESVGNLSALAGARLWACANGKTKGMCDQIKPNGACNSSDPRFESSYAFSAYWAQMRPVGATCDFQGLADITKINPSTRSCKFPSVVL